MTGSQQITSPNAAAVYTVPQVAQLLSLSLGGTYALVRSGAIPARKIGARWVIPKGRFHAWLDSVDEEPSVRGDYAELARGPRQ
jgi:excisionase family DNA binding protein